MKEHYKKILEEIGEDPTREGLIDTPDRCEKAMQFLTKGYHETLEEVVSGAIFPTTNDEMIIVKDIELFSLCEHHLLPFFGKCHVGYLPSGKIIGLSKIARIADLYARRLQVQENLTVEIANAVSKMTGAVGVGVIIEAEHLCMKMRGVEKQHSKMTTSCMLGAFKKNERTRQEFLQLIR